MNLEELVCQARELEKEYHSIAWAACAHLLTDNTEFAIELAQKAQDRFDEWQATCRDIGHRVLSLDIALTE